MTDSGCYGQFDGPLGALRVARDEDRPRRVGLPTEHRAKRPPVQDMGLPPACHVAGGFAAWREAGGPVEARAPKAPKPGRVNHS